MKSGVELALGHPVIDPDQAIPADYTGDGSYEVKFTGNKGQEIVRREYIGVYFLGDIRDKSDREVLEASTRPFAQVHPDNYRARVEYEVYLDSMEGQKNGRPNNERYNKSDYEFGEWDLRRWRRELMLADGQVAPTIRED